MGKLLKALWSGLWKTTLLFLCMLIFLLFMQAVFSFVTWTSFFPIVTPLNSFLAMRIIIVLYLTCAFVVGIAHYLEKRG